MTDRTPGKQQATDREAAQAFLTALRWVEEYTTDERTRRYVRAFFAQEAPPRHCLSTWHPPECDGLTPECFDDTEEVRRAR